jgi:hypothetical protein
MAIALASVILSIVFGVEIGWLMAVSFRADDEAHDRETSQRDAFARGARVPLHTWAFFTLLLAVLIAGTLQVRLLTGASAQGPQVWLDCVVPPSAALGIEGLSTHGVLLNGG